MKATPATVKDLIEFLQTLPPTHKVEVLQERTRGYNTCTEFVCLELPLNVYTDGILVSDDRVILGVQ